MQRRKSKRPEKHQDKKSREKKRNKKRKMRFTPYQKKRLWLTYRSDPDPPYDVRLALAVDLALSKRQINNFFSNRKRRRRKIASIKLLDTLECLYEWVPEPDKEQLKRMTENLSQYGISYFQIKAWYREKSNSPSTSSSSQYYSSDSE
jgi:hypothetical protein